MRIPENFLTHWKSLRSRGDAKKISLLAKVCRATVSRAFNDEVCSDHLFQVMANYYNEKQKTINNLNQKQ